jgi:hypothetical protein
LYHTDLVSQRFDGGFWRVRRWVADLEAQVSAFVADKDGWSGYQLGDVMLALAAEIAIEGVRHHSYSVINSTELD